MDEERPISRRVAEIVTWVLLFFLVPGTVLGYYSENSLPQSPLYPVKRSIEQGILALASLNGNARAFYELTLANNRFKETKQVLENQPQISISQASATQLSALTAQVQAAQKSISLMPNGLQKQQAAQQLVQQVTSYKAQLIQIQSSIQFHPIDATNNTNTSASSGSPTPTPAPDNSALQSTINSLNSVASNLQNNAVQPNPEYTVTPPYSPTPTAEQVSITPAPTQAPYWWGYYTGQNHPKNNSGNGGN